MESLVGYGSEDEVEERYGHHRQSSGGGSYGGSNAGSRRRDDDTNYDEVNMDMSEDSQNGESEPELPQAEPAPPRHHYRQDRKNSGTPETKDRERDGADRRRRETPPKARHDREKDRRSPKRDDRHRSERTDRSRDSSGRDGNGRDGNGRDGNGRDGNGRDGNGRDGNGRDGNGREGSRRGLLGDRPDDRGAESKPPALMDLKPFGDGSPPALEKKSQDARDAVSPRFSERDRRDRDKERDRDREHRTSRHDDEKRSSHKYSSDRRERSRSRGAPSVAHASSSNDRRSPTSDYRPSYKVNKKLEVMEKMGLQIKTPDGSMATAQQLRAAASDPVPTAGRATFFNHGAMSSHRILDQVQKRKLLWSNKAKKETEEAAKWSGTRFAQDNDGKQVSKFMRLMGIKEPGAVKPEPPPEADPIKKQEELFQAMQAQYEVARATTHTMRGVGLGFQRGQF